MNECRILSIFDLKREGLLEQGTWQRGTWSWRDALTQKRTASLGYELNTQYGNAYFRVYYTITRWDGRKHDYDYKIGLQTTACNFGSVRWWFTCPLVTNGRSCGRRVGKLYMPPGGQYYGCRHCYDLTYRSSQENDKRVNALKRLGPMAILEGINTGDIDFIQGLKALPDDIWRR
ncbi:MAG: hypothetical protein H6662_16250 [Ardenticatenaceae bacterium]|nr:hypothetical protein [Anaerolineales bacterium]MCB8923139.1 hypothetical protein [Ardenticatenaceae bacterium]